MKMLTVKLLVPTKGLAPGLIRVWRCTCGTCKFNSGREGDGFYKFSTPNGIIEIDGIYIEEIKRRVNHLPEWL